MEHLYKELSILADETMNTLLDIYQMLEWNMTWKQFLDEYSKIAQEVLEHWKKEEIGEE